MGNIASCIVDLPNIEQIATGSYKRRIELWELRTESNSALPQIDLDDKTSVSKSNQLGKGNKSQVSGSRTAKKTTALYRKGQDEPANTEEKAKTASKTLNGH